MLNLQRRKKCRNGNQLVKLITNFFLKLKIWKNKQGQDVIEYALMAGFAAIAAGIDYADGSLLLLKADS